MRSQKCRKFLDVRQLLNGLYLACSFSIDYDKYAKANSSDFIGSIFIGTYFFREEWFVQSNAGIWIYRVFALGGMLLIAGAKGRLFSKKMMWVALLSLFLLEGCFGVLFYVVKNGQQLPEKVTKLLGYIYLFHCRDYIVYEKNRGRYDPELFYTLKPGEFDYSNMEFSTKYKVNKAGLRDDESSLDKPEIIFLGDSYTMGWGVEQEESYVAILEKEMDRKTLNAGIASYGTARELLTFGRLQKDSCKLLVLQFCPNDVKENRAFLSGGFHLEVSPEHVFEKELIWNKLYRFYFPLKYLHAAISYFVQKIKNQTGQIDREKITLNGRINEREIKDFFAILEKIKAQFNGHVILFNLGMGVTNPVINEQFEAYLKTNPMEGIFVFPSSDYLMKEDYLLSIHI